MNVYDFDNTILRGDSTARFFAWCLIHRPAMWRDLPGQAVNALLFAIGRRPKQAFKERMLHFVTFIGDRDRAISDFWRDNAPRVKPWYLTQRRPDDVVISASPEFLIAPICRSLGVGCAMGSPVDVMTGRFHGLNCHGEEKVRRFRERFPEGAIDAFYSDSRSDAPLAALAARAYLVRGDRLIAW